MKKFYHPRLNETYYKDVLPNGLTIYLYPKETYQTTIGTMVTNFGSDDICFVPKNSTEYYNTPTGIAHFLEHKLFDLENGEDIAVVFDNLGASCNAYTTNDRTVFYFSTTKNEIACVNTLIDLVQKAYFKEDAVEKEKSIIIEEVQMHKNKVGNFLNLKITENLFETLPVRNDIGGSIEDIKRTTVSDLYKTYNTFYNPSNLALIVVGKFDLNKMYEAIVKKEESLSISCDNSIKRFNYNEKSEVNIKDSISYFDIPSCKTSFAIKIDERNFSKKIKYLNAIYLDFYLDYYFSPSSPYVLNLKKNHIILGNLGCFQDSVSGFRIITFTADLNENKVNTFKEEIMKIINDMGVKTVEEIEFTRMKKSLISSNIEKYNSLFNISDTLISLFIFDFELFQASDLKENINYKEFINYKKTFKNINYTIHTIYPNGENK